MHTQVQLQLHEVKACLIEGIHAESVRESSHISSSVILSRAGWMELEDSRKDVHNL